VNDRGSAIELTDPRLFSGRTYRSVNKSGSRLIELFTLITNECQDPDRWLRAISGRGLIVFLDDWAFGPTEKAGAPSLVYRREWPKGTGGDKVLLARFRATARQGWRPHDFGVGGVTGQQGVEVEQWRREERYSREGAGIRKGDPWASATTAYEEYSGYLVVETSASWVECIYYGVMPAFPRPEDAAQVRAQQFSQKCSEEAGGQVVIMSEPRRIPVKGGIGMSYPWRHEFGVSTRMASQLTTFHPEHADAIETKLIIPTL
jgi:hypothetical protein